MFERVLILSVSAGAGHLRAAEAMEKAFVQTGAAIRCNNLPILGWKIDRLLDEPSRLAQLQTNARRLGRPRAALDIVETLKTLQD